MKILQYKKGIVIKWSYSQDTKSEISDVQKEKSDENDFFVTRRQKSQDKDLNNQKSFCGWNEEIREKEQVEWKGSQFTDNNTK